LPIFAVSAAISSNLIVCIFFSPHLDWLSPV
jgi:hypothetical protein